MNNIISKYKFLPLAIIGLALILGIMVIYPKLNNKAVNKNEKVTIENEFQIPQVTPNNNNGEEKTNAEKFVFSITSPVDKTITKNAKIVVSGKTVSQADIFVNEVDSKADNQGNFSVYYTLETGENYLIIGANDEFGNYAEKELVVNYEP